MQETLSSTELEEFIAKNELQSTAYAEHRYCAGFANQLDRHEAVLYDIVQHQEHGANTRLAQAIEMGNCEITPQGYHVVKLHDMETVSPEDLERYFPNEGEGFKFHLALQIANPQKYIELLGDQMVTPQDYIEFCNLQEAALMESLQAVSEEPRKVGRPELTTEQKQQRKLDKENSRSKYNDYVADCQARKTRINEAKKDYQDTLAERKAIIHQWDCKVADKRRAWDEAKLEPVPDRSKYK